jgi:hypothetical protein
MTFLDEDFATEDDQAFQEIDRYRYGNDCDNDVGDDLKIEIEEF